MSWQRVPQTWTIRRKTPVTESAIGTSNDAHCCGPSIGMHLFQPLFHFVLHSINYDSFLSICFTSSLESASCFTPSTSSRLRLSTSSLHHFSFLCWLSHQPLTPSFFYSRLKPLPYPQNIPTTHSFSFRGTDVTVSWLLPVLGRFLLF